MFDATVVIRRYSEPDELWLEALEALSRQEGVHLEVLVQDHQHSARIESWVSAKGDEPHGHGFRYRSFEEPSLSRARNRGVAEASADYVLFSEPDAVPDVNWAAALLGALQSGAAIAGTRITPKYLGKEPFWTSVGFVRDQYSLLDLGPETFDVPKVFGASFGLDRRRVSPDERGEYFSSAFGRRGGRLFGGEETELCARVRRSGGRVVYVGSSEVRHQIAPERLRYSWIARRFYFAGRGRAQRGGAPSPSARVRLGDWILAAPLLPWYALGLLHERCSSLETRTSPNT